MFKLTISEIIDVKSNHIVEIYANITVHIVHIVYIYFYIFSTFICKCRSIYKDIVKLKLKLE